MSVAYSPRIISNGLMISFDLANQKSWRGRPTTNQFLAPTPDSNNNVTFAGNGTGTFKRLTSGTYGGYTIQPQDVVYRYDLGTSGCHYHGNSAAIASGQYVTWSFDFYVSPNVSSYSTNFLANLENYGGSALSAGITDATPSVFGVWKRVSQTFGPTTNTGTQAMFLYPGGCNPGTLATTGYILYKNAQVEFTSTSIGDSPFVNGTRSTAQSLIDQTGNYTCNVVGSNFSYAADSLTINNVNDSYVDVTAASGLRMSTNNFTIGAWVRQLDTGLNSIIEARGTSLLGYLFLTNYPTTGQICMFLNYTAASQNYYNVTATGMTANVDQYLCAVVNRSAGVVQFYINGNLIGTATGVHFSSISPSGGDIHRIGYDLGGGTTNMKIYSYHVYNRALTSTEVSQNFNAMRGRFKV